MRAAALRHTDLTEFVLQPALREAKAVIEEAERIVLSERDSLLVETAMSAPGWHEEPFSKSMIGSLSIAAIRP